MRTLSLLCLGLSIACADARASRTRESNAEEDWFEVTCRGHHRNCEDKAKEVCGPDYQIIDRSGRYDQGNEASFYSGRMRIRCDKNTAE